MDESFGDGDAVGAESGAPDAADGVADATETTHSGQPGRGAAAKPTPRRRRWRTVLGVAVVTVAVAVGCVVGLRPGPRPPFGATRTFPAGDGTGWVFRENDAATGGFAFHDGVVSGGRVFACTATDVVALDAATGRFLWSWRTPTSSLFWCESPGGAEHGQSIQVVDGVVVVNPNNSTVVALDAATGTPRWTAPWAVVWSVAAGDFVYLLNLEDHQIVAVDAATGSPRWALGVPGDKSLRPVAVVADTLLVAGRGGTLFAVNATNGSRRWHLVAPGALVVDDNALLSAVAGSGTTVVIAVRQTGGSTPTTTFSSIDAVTGTVTTTLVVPVGVDRLAASADGRLLGLDDTGRGAVLVQPQPLSVLPVAWPASTELVAAACVGTTLYASGTDPGDTSADSVGPVKRSITATDLTSGTAAWHYGVPASPGLAAPDVLGVADGRVLLAYGDAVFTVSATDGAGPPAGDLADVVQRLGQPMNGT